MENPLRDDLIPPLPTATSGQGVQVLPDLFCLPIQFVNVVFSGTPGNANGWVLVDAALPGTADVIRSAAEQLFGPGGRPKAILLTHGHFDHVGCVVELARLWNVPVYAHPLELPFVTGQARYPEPDATAEGGLITRLSALFPTEPVDLGGHARTLPADGTIPEWPGWRWIHTPGHAPGHVSFFRPVDRTLLAGDAFVTVNQDSLYNVITQLPEIHEPPRYFTTDWDAAWDSVKRLADLRPAVAVTGHGPPMAGDVLLSGLDALAREFGRTGIPDYGRFVEEKG